MRKDNIPGGLFYLNKTNSTSKKWLVLIAALIMLAISLKDFNFSQLEKLSFQDVLPIIVLTAGIFLLRTSLLSVILLCLQKLWRVFCKKDQ